MRNFTLFVFTLILFSQINFSQTPTPTPSKEIIEDSDEVVKISTNLVQIDVSVTDRKGNVVTDLKPEDFEIYENGKKREITNFSFIANKSYVNTNQADDDQQTDFAIPPKKIRPGDVRRTIALVVDDLHLSFESAHFVRRALRNFVETQMQDGDLVAIIRTGAGVGALQQFTTDKRVLLEAIKRVRADLRLSQKFGVFAPLRRLEFQSEKEEYEARVSPGVDGTDKDGDGKNDLSNEDEISNFRSNIYASGTLGALGYIVRGMGQLPGRKSVMLFSDGFSILAPGQTTNVLRKVHRLVDMANRASVVIYTLDPRGVVFTGLTAEDDTGGRTPQEIQQTEQDRSDEVFNTRSGLAYLAEETGGFTFFNNNKLNIGIDRVLNDQSYYLIGYQPDDESFNPDTLKFNRFLIKVKRSGVKVRYRSGFLGVRDEDIATSQENLSANEKVTNAMISPFAVNDINLSMNTLFKSDEEKNLYLYTFLHIDAAKLKFSDDEDGSKKAEFDVIAMNFNDEGLTTEKFGRNYVVNIPKVFYEDVLKEGIVYSFVLPINKSGAYQMRVVVQDKNSEKVGSASKFVVIPTLKKKRLSLSGIALENISFEDWNKQSDSNIKIAVGPNETKPRITPRTATALRRFQRGTVLSYGLEIYNARFEGLKPQLEVRSRLFYNNKMIFEGKPNMVNPSKTSDLSSITMSGALKLGTDMEFGDYVLQLVVIDKLAKTKRQIATEFVQFEIVE